MHMKDTLFLPKAINLPPIRIPSGRYKDCEDLCKRFSGYCYFFVYFTPDYQGTLSSYCVLFEEKLVEDKIYMKNVISGEPAKLDVFIPSTLIPNWVLYFYAQLPDNDYY